MALIQFRRGTAASAASNNPVLSTGEPAYETDTGVFKIGDGATTYNNLRSAGASGNLVGFTPPPGGWTNLGSPTITTSYNSRLATAASAAGDSWRGEYRSLASTTNYTATFYFDWAMPDYTYAQSGILLRNSGGNSLIMFGAYFSSGFNLVVQKYTNTTSFSGYYKLTSQTNFTGGMPHWLQVRDDNTDRYYEYSYNGVDWARFYSGARTDFLVPNQIGWGLNPNNNGGTYTMSTRLRSFIVT